MRTAGSGFSGTLAAQTPTEWARKANTTSNWQNLHHLLNPPLRTQTQRMTQVCLKKNTSVQQYTSLPLSYHQSEHSSLFTEAELMEKSSHPTAMMLTSTVNLLKTLSLSSGIYAEVLQTDATRTLCGLLRMLVESGANDKGKAASVINNKLLCDPT